MLALFGLFLAIAYAAPWWVWVIGFLCVLLDSK
jgi:uncharacterized membrane protein YecN with MAPEG domain